jgi:hypothetical protein
MKSLLIATVAVCAASAAQAQGYGHGHGHYGAMGSHAFSQSSASASARAFGGNAQAFGGNASAAGFGGTGFGGNAYGGNQSVNFRNRVGAPASFAAGPVYGGGNVCGSSVGLSAGAPMFSFGFSIPVEQTQCTYRENAYAVTRVTGNRTAGMLVLAQEPGMRAALAGAGLILEPVYDQQTGSWTYPQRTGVRRARYPR